MQPNMTIIGRCLLNIPRSVLAIFAVDPFKPEKISMKCLILNAFQFLVTLTGIMVMKDFQEVDADLWITCITSSQGAVKVLVILIQRQRFVELGKMLNNFQLRRKSSYTKQESKYEGVGMRCQQVYAFLMIVAVTNFMIKPILLKQRILPSVGYCPCDIHRSVACYVVLYIVQCCAGIYAMAIVIAVDGVFCSLLFYGYFELEYVKSNLYHLSISMKHNGDDPDVLKQITFTVEHHDQTLRYLSIIKEAYSGLLLYQCCSTLFIVGMSQFCLTINGFPPPMHILLTYISYYLAGCGQMFVYCITGGVVADQSESVGDAAFASGWWVKHQPQFRRAVGLMITRSRRTMNITVGGLWVLNLQTFSMVIKTSMSLLAFMKTAYDN